MTGRVILASLAALLGVAAGLGAFIGAATITDRPPPFLLAGLLAFCVAYSLGLLLATRGISSLRKRRFRAALFCAGTALIVGAYDSCVERPTSSSTPTPRRVTSTTHSSREWCRRFGQKVAS